MRKVVLIFWLSQCWCSVMCKFLEYGSNNVSLNCIQKNFFTTIQNYLKYEIPHSRTQYKKSDIFEVWTLFPIDIFTNVSTISPICQFEYRRHVDAATRNELNSLKMFDASAKPSSGLLRGNINQFGDFDECLEVPNAQYCLALIDLRTLWKLPLSRYKDLVHAHFSIQENFDDPAHRIPGSTFVRWGFCIPKSCTKDDLVVAVESKLNVKAKIRTNMCQTKDFPKETLSWVDNLAKGYFIFVALCIGFSTILYKKGADFKDKIWMKVIMSFAIQKNYKKLCAISKSRKEYRSLHGIRCLSAISLLMAHKTMAALYNPYINKTWMAESQAMKWSVLGRNAIIYTDCFLLISGLLNANALFAELEKCQRMNFKDKVVNRLFR